MHPNKIMEAELSEEDYRKLAGSELTGKNRKVFGGEMIENKLNIICILYI